MKHRFEVEVYIASQYIVIDNILGRYATGIVHYSKLRAQEEADFLATREFKRELDKKVEELLK